MTHSLHTFYRAIAPYPLIFNQVEGIDKMATILNGVVGTYPPAHIMHCLLQLKANDVEKLKSQPSLNKRAQIYVAAAYEAQGICAEALPQECIDRAKALDEGVKKLRAEMDKLIDLRKKLQASMASHAKTQEQHAADLKALKDKMQSIRMQQEDFKKQREQLEKDRKDCKHAFNDMKKGTL